MTRGIGIVACAVLVHLFIALSFFYPFHFINGAMLVLLSVLYATGRVSLWVSVATFFCLELFSGFGFGIVLISGVLSVLVAQWLHHETITHRSWYGAVLIGALSIAVQRLFFAVGVLLSGSGTHTAWLIYLQHMGWELFGTGLMMGGTFFVIQRYARRISPSHLILN